MNLPVTNPIVRNVSLEMVDVNKLFLDLSDKKFDGYAYLTILGVCGFEEVVVVLSAGKINGIIFLMPQYEIELYGKEAILFGLNSFGSKQGILNIFGLTQDQIKLILLFNEKIKFPVVISNKSKKSIFEKVDYNPKIIETLLNDRITIEKTNKDILNDFNLNDLLK